MRITVAPIGIEVGRISLQIRAPGTVRHVAFEAKPNLLMTRGQPDFKERPVIFVEASPEGPLVNRTFVAITQGEYVELDDDERAVWVGTGVSGRGLVVHVFEIREVAS